MAKRNIYQLIMISGLLINLFGCVNRTNILQDQALLDPATITHWKINGKISGFDKKSGWRSSILWSQSNTDLTVRLIPTLTSRKILLQQTSNLALFETEQEKITGDFLDKILYDRIGWYIPFASLQYWLKGLPDPKTKYDILSRDNTIKEILQNGWKIEYKSFVSQSGYLLPKKIFISNKSYNIRLIINNWILEH